MTRSLAAAFIVLLFPAGAHGQQPRDPVGREPIGTASITGTLLSDDSQPRPLRRARVILHGGGMSVGRTRITADDGSFSFSQLPAGRYTLTALKEGYVLMTFGARRPWRPGVPIAVAENENRRVSFRLPRGAVITGTLTTEHGQPLGGVNVRALRSVFSAGTGGRGLALVAGLNPVSATTDDRGSYRIYGLAAGEYAVAADPGLGPAQGRMWSTVERLTATEIGSALAAVRDSSRAAPSGRTKPTPTVSDDGDPRKLVRLAPVFFPGTTLASQATLLKVAAGEERTGVDFTIDYVPTATIEGHVTPVDPAARVQVTLLSELETAMERREARSTDAEGKFTFSAITPGSYTVMARTMPTSPVAGDVPQTLVGSTQITVAGENIAGVVLALTPGLTISGQVRFEGAEPPSLDFSKFRTSFLPASTLRGVARVPGPRLEADGRFQLTGLIPGRYMLHVEVPGLRSPIGFWWLQSVTVGGRELLDVPLEIHESASDAVITFSARASTLTGFVSAATDASGGHVIVFASDPKYWFFNSRRVAAVLPDDKGRYTIRNLPPGDYLAAAVEDVEGFEWFDPEFLSQLAPRAKRVRVGTDAQTLDLTWQK